MKPSSNAKYRVSSELVDRSLGKDLLVHCFESDQVFVLNAHARLVFEAIGQGAARSDIDAKLARHGVGDADAPKVDALLADLVQKGIVREEA